MKTKKILLLTCSLFSVLLILTACNTKGQKTVFTGKNDKGIVQTSNEQLIFDSTDIYSEKLRNYRSCNNIDKISDKKDVSTDGLETLRMSGSAEFSSFNWDNIVKDKKTEDIIILDLRMECHAFVNDQIPISWYTNNNWYNLGRNNTQINDYENSLIENMSQAGTHRIYLDKNTDDYKDFDITSCETEKEFVENRGSVYIRFYVPDHCRPSDKTVAEFINLVKNTPDTKWLHFHCRAGKGRTTTFMTMYDILKNSSRVSFDDIIRRQHYLGGSDLSNTDVEEFKKKEAETRLQFLKDFYSACRENNNKETFVK